MRLQGNLGLRGVVNRQVDAGTFGWSCRTELSVKLLTVSPGRVSGDPGVSMQVEAKHIGGLSGHWFAQRQIGLGSAGDQCASVANPPKA